MCRESQILCQRDEFRRGDKSQLCTVPSDQCLSSGADIPAALNINDGLIIDLELPVALHRGITHVLFHIQAASRYGINALAVGCHPVLTGLFCFVHGNIRFFDQISHGIPGIRESDDTHTHGTVIVRVLQKPGLAEDLFNIFHNIFKPGIAVGRNHDDKFIAAHAVTGILDAVDPF